MKHATIHDWIHQEALPFTLDSPRSLDDAVDCLAAAVGDAVRLLGFGEALHGAEELLQLRNGLFRRLVEAHGYSAIVLESSFPMARFADDYAAGRGPAAYETVRDTGFSHGYGQLSANRELLEWMRAYNADPGHCVKLRFYGCDLPRRSTPHYDMAGDIASPRQLFHFVLDYLAALDMRGTQERRERIDALLAQQDPAAAASLRVALEELIRELRTRQPALVAAGDAHRFAETLQYARLARHLLNYCAAAAANAGDSTYHGIRDLAMADNLAYIVARESGRGKVFAFTHNLHLRRGQAVWFSSTWWSAGAHLQQILGERYAVIGSALGSSQTNGFGPAAAGTLEARLTSLPETGLFIPTHHGQMLPRAAIEALPVRSASKKNPTYIPLAARSFTDFDWLAFLDSATYIRGAPPLPE